MKKSTLLSLLTAGAVIATSAGTFAAWDQTKATASGEVTINTRVTTTATANVTFNAPTELSTTDGNVEYTGNATINVSGMPDTLNTGYKLNTDTTRVYKYSESAENHKGDEVTAGVSVTATDTKANEGMNGEHPINVKLTVTDDADGHTLAGEKLIVEVDAELEKNAS